MATAIPITEATPGDLPAVEAVLRAAGFGAQVGPLLTVPLQSPRGAILMARSASAVDGVVAVLAFPDGATGWIGALGVRPAIRRRGLGLRLTEAAIAWLHEHGAAGIGLYATDAGLPLYERLGFTAAGLTVAWRGTARHPTTAAPVRPLCDEDRDAVLALDRVATGEVRAPVLSLLSPLRGWAVEGDDSLRAFGLRTPWSAATPVLGTDTEAGIAVMAAAASARGGGTLIVPETNVAASDAVRSWGLTRLNHAVRMQRGAAPPHDPARQFATFNLFWG